MTVERPYSADRGSGLANQMLNDVKIFHELSAGGKRKEIVLENIVSELGYDFVAQDRFLKKLFESMAMEGGYAVTNRREAALTILTDTANDGKVRLTKAMRPLIRARSASVFRMYLKAIQSQTKENDPVYGSIDTLLDAGSALVRCVDLSGAGGKKEKILIAWTSVTAGLTDPGEQSHIRKKLEDTQSGMMHPFAELDDQVEKLRLQGLTYPQIAEQLDEDLSAIHSSIARLQAERRVGKRKKTTSFPARKSPEDEVHS